MVKHVDFLGLVGFVHLNLPQKDDLDDKGPLILVFVLPKTSHTPIYCLLVLPTYVY